MTTESEKRKAPRLPLDVEVNSTQNALARSKNISEGGLCLISENAMENGKIYNLLFHMPVSEEPVQALGKVVRVEKVSEHFYEYGITFWEIKETDREKIRAYFANNSE